MQKIKERIPIIIFRLGRRNQACPAPSFSRWPAPENNYYRTGDFSPA
jgi:hypothetical protein